MAVREQDDPIAVLRRAVEESARACGASVGERLTVERPPKAELGDYSTNAAMLLAPALGSPPREVAERLGAELAERLGEDAERVAIAGPGFLNVFLSDRWHREAVVEVLGAGERSGAVAAAQRIIVEFVSANPTGPLTVAGGRGAAFGDSLARMLAFTGQRTSREYYVNDEGAQVRLFAESIAARMRGEEPPADGYAGEYVSELANELRSADVVPEDLDELERLAIKTMRERIDDTLRSYRVSFDTWFSERSLHESGAVGAAIDDLRRRGHVYDSDGAVWLRTTEFGDDKDRVLIRADGEPTYFGADIAYHRDKMARGERTIVPLGADHHGYLPRMKAAFAALGFDPDSYEAPIMQLVSVVEGGERSRMSKRKGEFVTLDELIADIGVDAARYFMVQRSHDTTLDLDLELARKSSQDNPVYYVQYAHARLASILRKARAEGIADGEPQIVAAATGDQALTAAAEPAERALVRRLLELPAGVADAAARRAPHRLCAYATATAADFHAFYRDCRVVGATEPGAEPARLALCVAAKRTIATTLDLIGVAAPERM
jgi:arginyl-tRNA synthetase